MIEEQIKSALNELENLGILPNIIINTVVDESYVETIIKCRPSVILDCFAWADTPEGEVYWSDMDYRIKHRSKTRTFDVSPKELRTILLSLYSKSQYPEYFI